MKEIRFVVEGEPFGKQRPRHNGKVTYTPQETHDHEELVRWAYRSACRGFRFPDGWYIDLRVIAYMRIPKSIKKEARAAMLSGRLRPAKTPDWDNIGKLVADALNKIAYSDDRYIVDAGVRKFWSDHPRTEVILRGYDPEENT